MNTCTPSKRSNPALERLLHNYANQSKALVKPVNSASSVLLPLGAAFLAGMTPAEGAIIYTNPPDITLNGSNPMQNIDINNAWGNDVRFSFTSIDGHLNVNDGSYSGNGFNVDGFNADMSSTMVLPYARFGGFNFNGGGTWNEAIGSGNRMADGLAGNAPFARWDAIAPGQTRFLGVRGTMDGGGTHYAWVRITFYSVNNIVIHDWAYESSPDVGITAGEAPLPIELTNFAASLQVQDVQLRWQTASEQNNAGFDIQRSEDGTSFRSLAWVEGKGTTSVPQEYFYDDKNLREGKTYYYRLRQVDFDGQFDFSPIVTVTVGGKGAVAGEFYPNPASGGQVSLDFTATEDGEWSLSVFDAVGKLTNFENQSVFSVVKGSNALSFDVSGMPGGVYFVKMDNGTERVYRKLVVERLRG